MNGRPLILQRPLASAFGPRRLGALATCVLASIGPLAARDRLDQAGGELRALNSRIAAAAGEHKPIPDIPSAMKRIELGFADAIAEYLNGPSPSANDLTGRLERAVAVWAVVPGSAAVITVGQTDKPTYVAAVSLAFCGSCSRTWLGVYQSNGGRYVNAVQLDNALPNKTVQLLPLPADDGKPRFLFYGVNLGDAHTRLTVVIYSLDGRVLTSVWSRKDLPGGTVSVANGKLILQYRSDLSREAPQITQIYTIKQSGLSLEKEFRTPQE